jgi:hypothetical protein
MNKPVIFISYSHADEAWKDRVEKQLRALQRFGVNAWSDRSIAGGANWEAEIRAAVDPATLAVLIVSENFLTSEFITAVEVEHLRQRASTNGLKLYPIIVSPCPGKKVTWLNALQCRPREGKALASLPEPSIAEHLSAMAEEIASLLGVTEPDTDTETSEPSDGNLTALLKKLINSRGNVAPPPADLQAAIAQGLRDVSNVLAKIDMQHEEVSLDDVSLVIHTAIRYGAGIYNHSDFGHIGCALIYHSAAAGLLELMPGASAGDSGLPPRDSRLALNWLHRIVGTTPGVTQTIADDLAWELRFAFDSVQYIPQCDMLREALAGFGERKRAREHFSGVLLRVLNMTRTLRETHVSAYVLRHAAETVVALIDKHRLDDRCFVQLKERLSILASRHPRILRSNLAELAERLAHTLAVACQELRSTGNGPSASPKHWFWSWFGRN